MRTIHLVRITERPVNDYLTRRSKIRVEVLDDQDNIVSVDKRMTFRVTLVRGEMSHLCKAKARLWGKKVKHAVPQAVGQIEGRIDQNVIFRLEPFTDSKLKGPLPHFALEVIPPRIPFLLLSPDTATQELYPGGNQAEGQVRVMGHHIADFVNQDALDE